MAGNVPPADVPPAEERTAEFALSPSLLPQAAGFIDYATREEQKLYSVATAPLDDDEKFDGKGDNLALFKELLKSRVREAGWENGNGNIIDIRTEGGRTKNLITEYGQITVEQIKSNATENIVNKQSRAAQNNHNMYECLEKSMSSDMNKQMISEIEGCEVGSTKIAALLYKLIMSKCEIDTKATVSSIRMSLMSLDSAIQKSPISNNIIKFNEFVNEKITVLKARGETTHELLIYLFKAYKAVPDNSFVNFIKKKEDDYLHDADDDMTYEQLMKWAEVDYKIKIERGE